MPPGSRMRGIIIAILGSSLLIASIIAVHVYANALSSLLKIPETTNLAVTPAQPTITLPDFFQTKSAALNFSCMGDSMMRQLIEFSTNVVVVMPAKAGGTSMKQFAKNCNNPEYANLRLPGNLYGGKNGGDETAAILTNSWEMPGIVASHFWVPKRLSQLLLNAPRKTLIIYSHRDETSRLKSAALHVLTQWCPQPRAGLPIPEPVEKLFYKIDGNDCYMNEKKLVDKVFKLRPMEMQMGTNELLTCESYQSIEEYAPNMAFMEYKSVGKVQSLLAEKYCPQLNKRWHETNPFDKKIYITREDNVTVTLAEWVDKKLSYLEWTLELSKKASCLAKTRRMEDEFESCGGGFLSVKSMFHG